jgi:hypothetical protein
MGESCAKDGNSCGNLGEVHCDYGR